MRKGIKVSLTDTNRTLSLKLLDSRCLEWRLKVLEHFTCRCCRGAKCQEVILHDKRNTREPTRNLSAINCIGTLKRTLGR
ncbi:hypothetical protein D9M68_868370 [compost metagenome]